MGEITNVLLNWPQQVPFDARKAIAHSTGLQDQPDALLLLAVEEFLDRHADCSNQAIVESFAKRFPEVQSVLVRRLTQLRSQIADEPHDWPNVGNTFLGFFLEELIGVGGLSRVYLCRQEKFSNRQVVLKVTPDIQREHELIARFNHENVIRLLSVHHCPATGLDAECFAFFSRWSAADLLECQDLHRGTRHYSPGNAPLLSEITPLTIVHDLCMGLSHVHLSGVLHNDIKPDNVLVSEDKRLQIIDFNAATPIGEPQCTRFLATLPYLAPELLIALANNPHAAIRPTVQSDIYSLALTILHLLHGSLPFRPPVKGLPFSETCQHILEARNDILLPAPPFRDVFRKALERLPSDRLQSPLAFLQEYERATKNARLNNRIRCSAIPASAALALSLLTARAYLQPYSMTPYVMENTVLSAQPAPGHNNARSIDDVLALLHEEQHHDALNLLDETTGGMTNASPEEWALRGYLLYLGNGTSSEVEQCYKAALAGGYSDPRVLNNLGVLYLQQRRIAEAAAVLDEGLAATSTIEQLWFNRAFLDLLNARARSTPPDPSFIINCIRLNKSPAVLKAGNEILQRLLAHAPEKMEQSTQMPHSDLQAQIGTLSRLLTEHSSDADNLIANHFSPLAIPVNLEAAKPAHGVAINAKAPPK